MKLAIVGSRDFSDYNFLKQNVLELMESHSFKFTHIVSGGAKGADTLGHRFAMEHQLEMIVFKPDWKRFGKRAGYIRNTDIIENSDIVIAFWDGKSSGTKDSIDKALNLNKQVIIKKFTS